MAFAPSSMQTGQFQKDLARFVTGDFQFHSGAVRTPAEALLATLPGLTHCTRMVALTNPEAQDLAVAIPAPGAFILAGLGVGSVGHLRRRRALWDEVAGGQEPEASESGSVMRKVTP